MIRIEYEFVSRRGDSKTRFPVVLVVMVVPYLAGPLGPFDTRPESRHCHCRHVLVPGAVGAADRRPRECNHRVVESKHDTKKPPGNHCFRFRCCYPFE